MKDSLIVLGIFVGGCLLGVLGYFPLDLKTGNLSIYILYALMFQIGISIGSNKELKSMISQLRLKFLLIPLATISGTLLFSAIASLLEYIRLYGGGEWFCLLFFIVCADYTV